MNQIFVFLLLAVATVSSKPPWTWSLEERLKVRHDRAAAAERVRKAPPGLAGASTNASNVIEGAENPELFLPSEVFSQFVHSSQIAHPKHYPIFVRSHSDDLFREGSDWERLRPIVVEYASLLKEERRLLKATADQGRSQELDAKLSEIREASCLERMAAHRRAREAFGAERFDRFLYTVVASTMGIAYAPGTVFLTESELRARIRREETCE